MKRVLTVSLPLIIILFAAVFFSFFITPTHAMSIRLSWTANTEPDLAGYRIYRKIHPDVDYMPIYDKCLADFEDPNNPTYYDPNLDNNTYYFVVTAYDTSGLESDYSNEVISVDNFVPTPPEVKKIIPHHKAGISDNFRVPNNTSFSILLEDSDGIDITDADSIRFTINDGNNPSYERDLSDANVVRVVKLDSGESGESDTQVTKLWVVYDRSEEADLGLFLYDQNINIKIDAKDIRQDWMEQAVYDFKIESEHEHDSAQANLPDTGEVAGDDPALTGPYDEGIQVIGDDLYGAKIIYNSAEVVKPNFGSINALPSLTNSDEAVSACMALQPPTVFSTPVKIFIPYSGQKDVSELGVYLYNGTNYVMACNVDGQVQPGGEDWMVPGSRVNHNEDDPATIEIKVYYFFGGVLAQEVLPKNLLPTSQIDNNADSGGAGGGCFINSL